MFDFGESFDHEDFYSVLGFSLSSPRHSDISLYLTLVLSFHSKQQNVPNFPRVVVRYELTTRKKIGKRTHVHHPCSGWFLLSQLRRVSSLGWPEHPTILFYTLLGNVPVMSTRHVTRQLTKDTDKDTYSHWYLHRSTEIEKIVSFWCVLSRKNRSSCCVPSEDPVPLGLDIHIVHDRFRF